MGFAGSPIGTNPHFSLRNSKIMYEPVLPVQMVKMQRRMRAVSGTNHCLLLRLSPLVPEGMLRGWVMLQVGIWG